MTKRRRVGMLWGLAAVASGLACSSDPDSVVVVTVTAPHGLPPVFQLRATATLAGSVDSVLFPEKAASTAIDFAPAATFGLTVPRSRAGSLQIAVDALDASAVAVARGTGSVAIAAGGRADVVIPLGLVTWGLDGGSGTDSGGPADLDGGLARDALDVATALDALVADGPMVVLDGASLEVAWLDVAPTWPDAGTPDVPIGGGGGAGGNGGAGGSASGGAGAGGASSRGGSSGTAGSTSTGGIQGTGGLTVAGGRTGTGGSSTSDAGSDQDASPCPGGQILCDGSCTDVQADNANCGACGRACTAATPSTAKCTVGRCLVTLDTEVLTSGSCRALDATRAYYMSSTSDILSIPLAGGTRTTLLARQSSCRGFALDQTGLYWTNVSDGTTDPNSGSVKKIPLQGGAVTTLASGLYSPESLAVDTGAVYWISYSGGTVLSMPLGGGTITTLASDLIYPTNLRIDARYVYWFGKGQAGTVQRAPLAGGGATVLASEQESTMDIVVDASYVYWSRRGYPGRILKLPLDGSSATPVTVMTMGQYEHPDNLAVDDAYLYWTVYNPSTENGSIVKMPLAGGAPVVLVSGQRSPVGLMVDATSLYWVNGMAPNKPLMRLTPK